MELTTPLFGTWDFCASPKNYGCINELGANKKIEVGQRLADLHFAGLLVDDVKPTIANNELLRQIIGHIKSKRYSSFVSFEFSDFIFFLKTSIFLIIMHPV